MQNFENGFGTIWQRHDSSVNCQDQGNSTGATFIRSGQFEPLLLRHRGYQPVNQILHLPFNVLLLLLLLRRILRSNYFHLPQACCLYFFPGNYCYRAPFAFSKLQLSRSTFGCPRAHCFRRSLAKKNKKPKNAQMYLITIINSLFSFIICRRAPDLHLYQGVQFPNLLILLKIETERE